MTDARAPLIARLLVGASLASTVVTAAFGVRSVGEWWTERAGLPVREQRASFGNVAWFRPEFTALVDRLDAYLPADAAVLVEPTTAPGGPPAAERGIPPPRWYLALAHYAWPRRFYVRRPALSAAFFNYDRWLDHHFEVLDLDDGGPRSPAAVAIAAEEERAVDARGIEWRLRIPVWPVDFAGVRLDRRVDGAWVEDPAFPLPEWRR